MTQKNTPWLKRMHQDSNECTITQTNTPWLKRMHHNSKERITIPKNASCSSNTSQRSGEPDYHLTKRRNDVGESSGSLAHIIPKKNSSRHFWRLHRHTSEEADGWDHIYIFFFLSDQGRQADWLGENMSSSFPTGEENRLVVLSCVVFESITLSFIYLYFSIRIARKPGRAGAGRLLRRQTDRQAGSQFCSCSSAQNAKRNSN